MRKRLEIKTFCENKSSSEIEEESEFIPSKSNRRHLKFDLNVVHPSTILNGEGDFSTKKTVQDDSYFY